MLIQQGEIPQAHQAMAALPDDVRLSKMGHVHERGVSQTVTKSLRAPSEPYHELTESHPSFGRAFQELGHLYRDNGAVYEALNAYGTACHLKSCAEG